MNSGLFIPQGCTLYHHALGPPRTEAIWDKYLSLSSFHWIRLSCIYSGYLVEDSDSVSPLQTALHTTLSFSLLPLAACAPFQRGSNNNLADCHVAALPTGKILLSWLEQNDSEQHSGQQAKLDPASIGPASPWSWSSLSSRFSAGWELPALSAAGSQNAPFQSPLLSNPET